MALSEQLLKQLEGKFGQHIWRQAKEAEGQPKASSSSLSLGDEQLDALLPDGGIPRGAVVEFALKGAAAWGTSLALAACRSAQQQALQLGSQEAWCAFVDPSRSLYGPGVVQAGVRLDRLLVAVPESTAVAQVALRIVRSRIFAVTVVDIRGVPGAWLDLSLVRWPRVVRQLATGSDGAHGIVLLLSDAYSRRPLPLPVALRLELDQPHPYELGVRVVKERHGRLSNRRIMRYRPYDASSREGSKGLTWHAARPTEGREGEHEGSTAVEVGGVTNGYG